MFGQGFFYRIVPFMTIHSSHLFDRINFRLEFLKQNDVMADKNCQLSSVSQKISHLEWEQQQEGQESKIWALLALNRSSWGPQKFKKFDFSKLKNKSEDNKVNSFSIKIKQK